MPESFFCRVGHQWQADGSQSLSSAVCPVCGLAAIGPAVTVDAAGATLPPADANAPTLAPFPAGTNSPVKLPAIPGYEVLEEIGRGGMGVVYKARQIRLNRLVAVKMILAGGHAGPKELSRFQAEAEAVARVQHPNIVQIYDVAESEGRPFLTLEYVEGNTLAQNLDGRPQEPIASARLIETLARAVHAAHQRGIIHRDLKPANVLLAPDGTPKIADFSLAKCLNVETGQTQSGAIVGTPSYMAPEQAGAKKKLISPAADVYALGAILYECLTGCPPFRADTPLDTILKVVSDDVVPPRDIQPKVPRDLETICLKCLEKQPAKRYSSAAQLAEDLHRFHMREPINARRISWWERARRRAKRYKAAGLVLAGAVGAVVLLLILGSLRLTGDTPSGESSGAMLDTELPLDLDLVPREAFGFISVRVADLFAQDRNHTLRRMLFDRHLGHEFLPFLGDVLRQLELQPTDIERATLVVYDIKADTGNAVIIVATRQPYDHDKAPLVRTVRAAIEGGNPAMAEGPGGAGLLFLGERLFVTTLPANMADLNPLRHWDPLKVLDEFLARVPQANAAGALRPALDRAASGRYRAIVGLHPPAQWIEDQLEHAPDEPLALLTPLGRPLALIITLESRPASGAPPAADFSHITANLLYPDEEQAETADRALPRVIEWARKVVSEEAHEPRTANTVFGKLLSEFEFAFTAARVERQGKEVHVQLALKSDVSTNIGEQLVGIDELGDENFREKAARAQSDNNLRQLAFAMHNFAARNFGELPPVAILRADGKPLLSWRVAILPYIEKSNLYLGFKLDEPWDSEHNKKLLAKMPELFASPRDIEGKQPSTTFYQVFVGPKGEALFETGRQAMYPSDITDGTFETFLIVETKEAVPWTKPDDIPYSSKGPLPKLGGIFPDGFNAAMADGTVRFIKRGVSDKTLRAFITPAGGDMPGDDWRK
jgi:hypothetical protein